MVKKIFAKGSGKRKKRQRGIVSLMCILAVLCTTLLSFLPGFISAEAASGGARLTNLIIDKVYELAPEGDIPPEAVMNDTGFSPDITSYTGTAYRSVSEIQVYPFAASASATVKVNGNAVASGTAHKINVSTLGEHLVTVEVTEGSETRTYTVKVTKVDTDYRGRRPIVENEEIMSALSVTNPLGNKQKLETVLKKNYEVKLPESNTANQYVSTDESYYSVDGQRIVSASPDSPITLFTIDLGDTYSVSRIRAVFGPSNLDIKKNRAQISVSTDGQNWQSPITKGNMNTGTQWHQNVTRYEFGVSYEARYIRFAVTNWADSTKQLRMYQFMVFYDAEGAPEKQNAPEGGSVPHQHEERHQYLASGQATVIERGLTISGWTPSSGYGRGVPTPEEAEQFGYDGPLFYDPDFENPDYMLYNPNALWGIAKAPAGGNNMASAGEPRDFVPDSMKPYMANAISFCFGDEGNYSLTEAQAFGKWFEWTRQHYPGVILHTNQYPNQWNRTQLTEYLRVAQPDMLVWDDYYGDSNYAKPSSINLANTTVQKDAARKLLGLSTWKLYRELAYGGIDGTGAKPILFGQYLDSFAFNKAQSAKNLIANSSILSGAKWLNFFRLEYQFDRAYLWDEDGTPTRGLLEWGQIIDRVHAVDDQLTRLNNDWIMFKVGTMGSEGNATADGFRSGNFDDDTSKEKNAEFGLSQIQVKSLSSAHSGNTGDVVLGYFNTLTGLYESEIEQYFEGATAPKAFMLMNGLIAGVDERYNQFDVPGREAGSSDNTRQEITVTVDSEFVDKGYTLYMVDKDDRNADGSGIIKEVQLSSDNTFTVTLGGGEANLYFWNTDTTAKANSQTEGGYASFAFDLSKETYWQPAEQIAPVSDGELQQTASDAPADALYTLENTFDLCFLDQVTLLERGEAIQGFRVEYKDADGNWKEYASGTTIGAAKSLSPAEKVQAQGVRLVITEASGTPAVYSVEMQTSEGDDSQQTSTVTINDNVLGDGLFRFNYDEKWSYRETETNHGTMESNYPIDHDGHFSNWNGAEAVFKFYGTAVTLHLRPDQAANISAAVYDESGQTEVVAYKAGTRGQKDLSFNNLSEENKVYTLKIKKNSASQAGIDGATVTYKGTVTSGLIEQYSDGSTAVQEYVDQRTTETSGKNYFEYSPSVISKDMGEDPNGANAGFNADSDENTNWVQHVQNAQYQNLGYTRTKSNNASYTLTFYGTGVTLYSGVKPLGDGGEYGNLTFMLDGEPIDADTLDTSSLGTNGKVSAGMWKISVPNAQKNETHQLTVTVTGGYNRIDYAVVDRFWESGDSVLDTYNVTATSGDNGRVTLQGGNRVSAGGNIVVNITPNSGYQIDKILVNNVSVDIPENGQLVLTNIRQNTTIHATFKTAQYTVTLAEMTGGTVSPDVFRATMGTEVTLTPEAYTNFEFVKVTVSQVDGTEITVKEGSNGTYTFSMPASDVEIKAQFRSTVDKTDLLAVIEKAEGLEEEKYTEETFAKVTEALAKAQDVYGNDTASADDVEAAKDALQTAIDGLKADTSELDVLIENAKKLTEGKYTEESLNKLKEALADAEELVASEPGDPADVAAAVTSLQTAMDELQADLTDLINLVEEAKKLDEQEYTLESWQTFQTVLTKAEMFVSTGSDDPAQVADVVQELQDAIEALKERVDKSALQSAVTEAKKLSEEDYTPLTFAPFHAALTAAETILGLEDATQEQVNQALADLQSAQGNLQKRADKGVLQALVDQVKDIDLSIYTQVTAEVFRQALADAQDVLADDNADENEVVAAYDALLAAHTELVPAVNKDALQAAITAAEALREEDYTPETFGLFADALQTAKEVLSDNTVSQADVDDALRTLNETQTALQPRADMTELQQLVDTLIDKELSGYTAETVQVFREALANAELVLTDANATQQEVTDAYNFLKTADEGLALKPDKGVLEALITEIQEMDLSIYTNETVSALNTALGEAIRVLEDDNADEEMIQGALNSLNEAKTGLILKPYKGNLENLINEVKEIDLALYTPDTVQNLSDALLIAEAVFSSENATEEEIAQAIAKLIVAKEGLVELADKTSLQQTVDDVAGLDLSQYTAASADVLRAALSSAQTVLGNANATQEEVTEAELALQTARNALKIKADTSALTALVNELAALDLSQYTPGSAAALQEAIANAQELLAQDIAAEQQQLVYDTITVLNTARSGLVPITPSPGGDSQGGETTGQTGAGQNAGGSLGQNPSQETGGRALGNNPDRAIMTGDGAGANEAAVMLLLLLGIMAVFAGKRVKKY